VCADAPVCVSDIVPLMAAVPPNHHRLRHNELGQPIGYPVEGFVAPPVPSPAVLVGRWTRLEALAVDRHAAGLFEANRRDHEGRMWTYMGYGPFAEFGAYRDWVRSVEGSTDPRFFAIVVEEKAEGVAAYLRMTPEVGTIEIGHIALSPALQRTTAATEAVFLMADHVFALGYRRFEWKCDDLNEPSKRAALRLGFSFEGVHRQATMYKGRNRDTAWFSILDREWPGLRSRLVRWLDPSNFDDSGVQRTRLSGEHFMR
jgi:RimJ/RimL family protein N-acetyltransferase